MRAKVKTRVGGHGDRPGKHVTAPASADSSDELGLEEISDGGEDLLANADNSTDSYGAGSMEGSEGGWALSSTEDSEVEAPPRKRRPSGTPSGIKYQAPASEEVAGMLDGDRFGSDLLRLQIDELLGAAVVKFNSQQNLDAALKSIKGCLDAMPTWVGLTADEASDKISSIPFPDPRPGPHTQYKFSARPPSKVQLVGSYPLGTLMRSNLTVDLMVEMPAALFQDKDYVNHRYFHKRAFYIAARQDFCHFDNDRRRPILTLTLADPDHGSRRFTVRIFPAVAPTLFSTNRLAPHQNNVRPSSGDALPPTPRYNNSLGRDMVFTAHMTFLHGYAKQCQAFAPAVVLVKAWLACRGFGPRGSTCKGFGGLLAAMLLAYLLQPLGGALSPSLSPYQLFKGLLDFLNEVDLARPILLGEADAKFSAASFKAHYPHAGAVVVDPTGLLHLAPYMTRGDWAQLQLEAKHSVELMKRADAHPEVFHALFVDQRHALELNYDHVLSFQPPTELPESWHPPNQKLDCPDAYAQLVEQLPGFLTHALGERIALAACHYQDYAAGPTPPLHVGLLLNPEHAWRLVDRGPSPHTDAAAADNFASCGGEGRAQAVPGRRDHRRGIIEQMVTYLLQRHLGVRLTRFWGDQLRQPLRLSKRSARGQTYLQDTARGFQPAIEAFDNLVKAVKLAPLPLSISAIAANAPGLRYTSTFIPQPSTLPQLASLPATDRYTEPMDAVIDFEPSTRWPEDLDAIQKLKAAFLLEIKRHLDQGVPSFAADTHLDVLAEGFLFRLRIRCTVEEELLLDCLSSALALYRRRFGYKLWAAPRLHGLCQAYPTLSYTIRLVKRWVSAHMLASHLSHEAIELACATIFFDRLKFRAPPNSPICGFARVLHRLSLHRFDLGPVSVKLPELELNPHLPSILTGDDFGGADPLAKRGRTDKSKLVPFAAPFLSDGRHLLHQDLAVPNTVIRRVQQLAAATLASLRSVLHCPTRERDEAKVLSWFVTPTQHFDFLIELKPHALTRRYQALLLAAHPPAAYAVGGEVHALAQLRPDFDPAESFLAELEARYGSFLHFFYGHCGGTTIGVVVDRTSPALAPAPLRTLVPYPYHPIAPLGSKLAQLHLEAALAEIRRLGQGLIADLVIQGEL
ncbi:U3 snoRNP protein [Massospora cicadina]|nr:U3 snoRNP protein [Massospora cicadina]